MENQQENPQEKQSEQPASKEQSPQKPRRKRWVLKIFIVIVVLLIVAVLAINPIARKTAEMGMNMALGTPTTLESVNLKFLAGEFQLNGLHISNPEGFTMPHFVDLKSAEFDVDTGTVFSDRVIAPRLEINGLNMNLEKKDGKANFKVIMDNLNEFSGKSPDQPEGQAEPAEPAKEGKKFTVQKVVLRDITVDTKGLVIGGDTPPLHFDEIVLENMGSETQGGMVVSQLMDKILIAVLAASAEHGVAAVGDAINSGVGGAVDLAGAAGSMGIEAVGGLGEAGTKAIGDIGKGATKGVDDAVKGLGGLLGGDKKEESDEEK